MTVGLEGEAEIVGLAEAAGRTTIVSKKLFVILEQKKAVAVWPERWVFAGDAGPYRFV